MRQGFQKYSDMRQAYFLNSTCDMAINKRQRHATLPFLKIDMRHWGPPIKGPYIETATYSSKRDSDTLWSFSVIFTRYGVMRVSMLKQALRSGILVIGTVRATVRLNSAVLN